MLNRKLFLAAGLAAVLMLFGSLATAQPGEIILTVALPEMQHSMLSARILQGFYEAHPGVKVVPVALPREGMSLATQYSFGSSIDVDEMLDEAESQFGLADVVMVDGYDFNTLMTRAGYVVDLEPYLRMESAATEDFYPVALETFSWDNGVWALPASLQFTFLTYDPEAFDEVGYPHPDTSWGLDDYLDAAVALTIRDESGKLIRPGFWAFDSRMLMRGLMGHRFYDDSTQPEKIVLNNSELVAAMERISLYYQDLFRDDQEAAPGVDSSTVPIQLEGSWALSRETPQTPVLFPGDAAFVSAHGFAISTGSLHPDLAFELIMYLTGDIEAVAQFRDDAPARRSLQDETALGVTGPQVSAAMADLIPQMLENGIPLSELRYSQYISAANLMKYEDPLLADISDSEALALAEELAASHLALAEARRETTIAVATPVATPVLSTSEVEIKFLLQMYSSVLPNRELWEQTAQEFAESDPQVGHVALVTNSQNIREDLEVVDCAYTSYNVVSWISLSLLQPLDPFFATDSTFDRSDIPAALWPSVTRDEKVYGFPLTLMPMMMWYNPATFEASDAPLPQNGWTVGDFIDTLKVLKTAQPGKDVYLSQTFSSLPYVLLAAGMGGVAIDYSTYMPTYHLTDPAVVEALRQTLDLSRDEYMVYKALGGDGSGTMIVNRTALYDQWGSAYDWGDPASPTDNYVPVTFPRGKDTIPMAYNMGVAYITSQTPYAEACYRWLSTLSQHPELFNETPARRSMATNQNLIAARGQTASDFYVNLFEMIDSPEAVVISSDSSNRSSGAYIANIWFTQAMDAYVLEDGDLETLLTEAQMRIDEYTVCTADIPPFDEALEDEDGQRQAYYKQFTDCAISVDPSLAPRFEGQSQ